MEVDSIEPVLQPTSHAHTTTFYIGSAMRQLVSDIHAALYKLHVVGTNRFQILCLKMISTS